MADKTASLMNQSRARIAPTPSGFLHEGNLLNFLITKSVVERHNGELGLRIDDLDQARFRHEYLQDIFRRLEEIGIRPDFGPVNAEEHLNEFKQSLRITRYKDVLNSLVATGQVFACSCSRKEILAKDESGIYSGTCRIKNIPLNTPNVSWRLRIDEGATVMVKHLDGSFIKEELVQHRIDPVIRRKEGIPSYDVASLADDVDMNINCIVRGEDLYESTLLQLHLASLIGMNSFLNCHFLHHELLTNKTGGKISKSAGNGKRPVLDISAIRSRANAFLKRY